MLRVRPYNPADDAGNNACHEQPGGPRANTISILQSGTAVGAVLEGLIWLSL